MKLPNLILLPVWLSIPAVSLFAQTSADPAREDIVQVFPGAKLAPDYTFHFPGNFEEWTIRAKDSTALSGLLFKTEAAKGVIFYLHGNTDGLDKWGKLASFYTDLHYDIFMPDYRGYGKSAGEIRNETQLKEDVQAAYDKVRTRYPEKDIVVLGYSIGTGLASNLAANNHPGKLILLAPLYSFADVIHQLYPKVDTTNLPFHFPVYQDLPRVTAPVYIFHGDQDKEFYYGSSEKLKTVFIPGDTLITLKGAGHLKLEKNKEYQAGIRKILE